MQRFSKSPRQAAVFKGTPDDFVVEEITKSGHILEVGRRYDADAAGDAQSDEGRFAVFVLQKRDWNTAQALISIANACGRGRKSVGFAGTKDRASVSTQLCSIFGADPDAVSRVQIKDLAVNGAWRGKEGVRLGDLKGNRFTITARGAADVRAIEVINNELGGIFPNYFGEQRFGFRNNNVEIGIAIMKGDFRSAAMSFLTNSENETKAEAVEARKRLGEEQDFTKALEYFPRYLKYERTILGHLAQHGTDFAGAIRKLPRQLSLMFVHSVESDMFNRAIEARVRNGAVAPDAGDTVCSTDGNGWPDITNAHAAAASEKGAFLLGNIIGYNTQDVDAYEKEVLESIGIEPGMFRLKGMPELSCKGTKRMLFAPYLDFKADGAGTGSGDTVLSFSLPSGSYATVLLDEFFERKPMDI